MLQVEGLRKVFDDLVAVDDLSFTIGEGEIFGLLGPNGAGKTTTLSMLSGVLKPDQGRVRVDGEDIWSKPKVVKRKLGVVPQEIAVYEDLTARDNLNFWGSLFGLAGQKLRQRVDEVLDRVGLLHRADDRVGTFSGGMKRRVNLSMGLIHKPRFLLLDEPTVGIDPQARLNILEVIREVANEGTSVLYTTHYMDEAQELCDRIAIIDQGKILTLGTLDELARLAGEGEIVRLNGDFTSLDAKQKLEKLAGLKILTSSDEQAVLSVESGGPGLREILPTLLDGDLKIDDVSIQPPSLQSVFIHLTGRDLRE